MILAILAHSSDIFAGTSGKITGQVTGENGLPLPGASVVIQGTKRGCITDESGIYFLLTVEPGRHTLIATTVGYEALPIIRNVREFIELQAGVTVDEEGDEIIIRAGDPEDVAYYFDGVPLPTTDHAEPRVYRNFNRLAIQEMTIITDR